jgi:hypothetical protein
LLRDSDPDAVDHLGAELRPGGVEHNRPVAPIVGLVAIALGNGQRVDLVQHHGLAVPAKVDHALGFCAALRLHRFGGNVRNDDWDLAALEISGLEIPTRKQII